MKYTQVSEPLLSSFSDDEGENRHLKLYRKITAKLVYSAPSCAQAFMLTPASRLAIGNQLPHPSCLRRRLSTNVVGKGGRAAPKATAPLISRLRDMRAAMRKSVIA
jgi:hypothetical protein